MIITPMYIGAQNSAYVMDKQKNTDQLVCVFLCAGEDLNFHGQRLPTSPSS